MNQPLKILRENDYHYFLKIKRAVIFCFWFFVSSFLFGLLALKNIPEFSENILSSLKELSGKIEILNNHELLNFIFIGNALRIFFIVILGFLFGLVPLIFLLINGVIIGLLAIITFESIGLVNFWLGIAPHGIFELPALLLGCGSGFFLGEVFYKKIFLRKETSMKRELAEALVFFGRVILPLLFIAAFIEVFVTQNLLNY